MRKYIHDYDCWLERELEAVKRDENISKKNKELILDFYRYNKISGISVPRLIRQIGILKLTARQVKKNFTRVCRKDYEDFVLSLMQRKLSRFTVCTYTEILKVFHKWLSKSKDYPECVEWMKGGAKKSKKLPEDLLTQEDVKKTLASRKQCARQSNDFNFMGV